MSVKAKASVTVVSPDTEKYFMYHSFLISEEAEVEWFYEDLQNLLELTPKKRCPSHYRKLECKSRNSRDTWDNRQIWPWSTE